MDHLEKEKKIFSAIRSIPPGKVASYGQIATIAGLTRGHRLVAKALHNSPKDLPWYRVIRADGHCGMAKDSEGFIKQMSLLKSDGVMNKKGRIDMKRYQWKTDMDTLIFRPQDL